MFGDQFEIEEPPYFLETLIKACPQYEQFPILFPPLSPSKTTYSKAHKGNTIEARVAHYPTQDS